MGGIASSAGLPPLQPTADAEDVHAPPHLTVSQWYSEHDACALLGKFSEWLDGAFNFGLNPEADAFSAYCHFIREQRPHDKICQRLAEPYSDIRGLKVPTCSAAWHKLQPDVQQLIKLRYARAAEGRTLLDQAA